MIDHSFTVFIDESGDEGFVFRNPPDKGSSDWFVVSAVVSFSNQQDRVRNLAARVRAAIGKEPKNLLHFADMSHERRVRAYHEINQENLRFVSVLVNKREIARPEIFQAQRGRLYYYSVRLLLERVSWLCRDAAKKRGLASPSARVILEHRKRLRHDDLVAYIARLTTISAEDRWLADSAADVRIDWNVIDARLMETAAKSQYAGLQIADIVASGIRTGLEANLYGNTEHRYAKMAVKQTYQRSGNFTSYGFKFFPTIPDSTHEYMHWVYKHCVG
ncbi:DUF3800 domain-containing protein [Pikeienuella piscinae]|uniref:DUF3800 domain-containing protein n=1 Tax=Pikeienuella piscinae TaxID=2748098 RepID=A0A7M3T6P4_9RHOB|nr:DUF3800 domain-containing protein [Pikeienuella piscinae]QIE57675.1 DUF3800 domain-containing protein [Pikeienuella piscinae]